MQDGDVSTYANILHEKNLEPNPFKGHYVSSVVPGMTKSLWIIDSGASTHVRCDIEMMVPTCMFEKPISVHLLDGSATQVLCG